MDIEQLSKSQIILLTLLTSFVTSIATGIVAVSLMDQAPPVVAQTVNRVVEHTVEKVIPAGQTAASTVTTEKTVVVNQADQIAQAVQKVLPSIVRIYSTGDSSQFLGLGVVLNSTGMIVTDSDALGDSASAVLVTPGSTSSVRVSVTRRDADHGLAFLQAAATSSDGKTTSWAPATISSNSATLGSSAVLLAGKLTPHIESGIITSVGEGAMPTLFDTNIPESAILPGSPLINTDGLLIGMSTGTSRGAYSSGFIPASALVGQSQKAPASGTSQTNENKTST